MKTTYSKSARDGQQAETFHGLWHITTSKSFSGKIHCLAVLCDEIGSDNGFKVLKFSTASPRHTLATSDGRATAAEIKATHEKGLARFAELYPETAGTATAGAPIDTAQATPERPAAVSPAPSATPATRAERSLSPFDRAVMLRDPIAWLRHLDVELRHLDNFTPHGGYIADYLAMVPAGDYQRFEDAETEREEAEEKLETANEDLEIFRDLIKSIIGTVEAAPFDSIEATAETLEAIAFAIHDADLAEPFNYQATSERIEIFGEMATEKSEDDFESMKAERDAAEARVRAMETRLNAALYSLHEMRRNAAQPVHSPASSPLDSGISTLASGNAPALSRNGEKNGIELRFAEKPDTDTREAMKAHGFKWGSKQPGQPWYARYDEERWVFATGLAEGNTAHPPGIPGEFETSPERLVTKPQACAVVASSLITDHCSPGTSTYCAFADF